MYYYIFNQISIAKSTWKLREAALVTPAKKRLSPAQSSLTTAKQSKIGNQHNVMPNNSKKKMSSKFQMAKFAITVSRKGIKFNTMNTILNEFQLGVKEFIRYRIWCGEKFVFCEGNS